jgi:diacylglycerol kinase (ATP)
VKPLRRSAGSFRYAIAGIRLLLFTQPNARIHLTLAAVALVLGILLRVSSAEMALLALTIGLVLALEAVNTALEAVVDLAQPEQHPLAAYAKDVAAGAVLLAALAALAVGALLFLPRLWALLW